MVLQTEERAEGFLKRLREHMTPDEPVLSKIAVRNGAPFFILKIRKKKDGVQWEDVAYAAGRCASRIVASEKEKLPENGSIMRFEPEHLPFLMLFATALDVLKKSGVRASAVRIGIVDRRGILAGVISGAAGNSGIVTVVTEREEKYLQISEKLMDECGASLVYGAQAELLRGCNIIICIDRIQAGNSDAAVFSITDSGIMHGSDKCFTAGASELPEEYAAILPDGIDPLIFASALYELCGVRRLENTVYRTLFCGGTEISLYGAAQRLHKILGG